MAPSHNGLLVPAISAVARIIDDRRLARDPGLVARTEAGFATSDTAQAVTLALVHITRAHGQAIWTDEAALRRSLDNALAPAVDRALPEISSLVEAVVTAALDGVPGAIVADGDLVEATRRVSEQRGPVLAARSIAVWARAIAELHREVRTTEPSEPLTAPAPAVPERAALRERAVVRGGAADRERAAGDRADPKASVARSSAPARAAVRRRRRRRALVVVFALAIGALVAFGLFGPRTDGPDGARPSREESSSTVTTIATVSSTTPPTTGVTSVTTVATTSLPTTTSGPAVTVPAGDGDFVWAVTPVRVLDTRSLRPEATAIVPVAGARGIPSGTTSALLSIRLEQVSGPGSATVVAAGAPAATIGQFSYAAGPAAATVLAPLSGDGAAEIRLNASQATFVVDVIAYAPSRPASGGVSFVAETPPRVLRDGLEILADGESTELVLAPGSAGALLAVQASTQGSGGLLSFRSGPPQDSDPAIAVTRSEAVHAVYVRADAQGRVRIENATRGGVRLGVTQIARFAAGPRPAGALRLTPTSPIKAAEATCSNVAGAGLNGVAQAFPAARALMLTVRLDSPSESGRLTVAGQSFSYEAGVPREVVVLAPVSAGTNLIPLSCSAGRPAFRADIVAVFE